MLIISLSFFLFFPFLPLDRKKKSSSMSEKSSCPPYSGKNTPESLLLCYFSSLLSLFTSFVCFFFYFLNVLNG